MYWSNSAVIWQNAVSPIFIILIKMGKRVFDQRFEPPFFYIMKYIPMNLLSNSVQVDIKCLWGGGFPGILYTKMDLRRFVKYFCGHTLFCHLFNWTYVVNHLCCHKSPCDNTYVHALYRSLIIRKRLKMMGKLLILLTLTMERGKIYFQSVNNKPSTHLLFIRNIIKKKRALAFR